MTDLNPQLKQMSDESMVRNLAAQAEAIWPQELPLLDRYGLAGELRILDAGCGTGEGAWRLAERYPQARVLGVDILDHHLELARGRHMRLGARLAFEHRSVYELGLPDASFDLVTCRHVLHSIPQADRVVAELRRVTRPGGWLHLIPEDYGMLHFRKRDVDPDEFWSTGPAEFGRADGTDLFIGRHIVPLLEAAGLESIRMDFVVVDTLRAPRATFAQIITAWRDGYVDAIAERTHFTAAEATRYFDAMIANILDPHGYAVWFVPVAGARRPA
ncbi:MAG TPA: methyltransferase domain-containing protein [Candidatus Acidoferrales bacterium]|nr:methyltransferase domain-containing protein [Candidatus Acidoferrales bacterium]